MICHTLDARNSQCTGWEDVLDVGLPSIAVITQPVLITQQCKVKWCPFCDLGCQYYCYPWPCFCFVNRGLVFVLEYLASEPETEPPHLPLRNQAHNLWVKARLREKAPQTPTKENQCTGCGSNTHRSSNQKCLNYTAMQGDLHFCFTFLIFETNY